MRAVTAAAWSPPVEVAILRTLVERDVASVQRTLSDPGTDVAAFLRFAHHHQLAAFVYSTLQELGIARVLPPRTLTATRMVAMRELAAGERLRAQLHALGDILRPAGTTVLFIKGPLFAKRFYPSIEARGLFDLDILVRADDLDTIETLLVRHGFESVMPVPVSRALARRFAHHVEYVRHGVPLDVHWQLQAHFTFAIDYARLRATSARIPLDGRTYDATSDEYELVLQCLGVLTDLQVGKLKLRSVVDIYRVLATVGGTLDWTEFFEWRAHERILRPSLYVLALVLDLLNCWQQFPGLRSALEARHQSLPPIRAGIEALFESRPRALGHKLLALRLYEAPLAANLAWWVMSLPFRLAIYGVTPRLLRPL
jgi:Uncharacterised nucleotidyltransferase